MVFVFSANRFGEPLEKDVSGVDVDHVRSYTEITCSSKSQLEQSSHRLVEYMSASKAPSSDGRPMRPQRHTLGFGTLSNNEGSDYFPWSCSTTKIWNKPSSDSDNDIWDVPETPHRLSDTPSPNKTLSPLTPPTPPSPSLKGEFGSKIRSERLPSSYFDDEVRSSEESGAWQDEDVKPGKLFRHCTAQLLESMYYP